MLIPANMTTRKEVTILLELLRAPCFGLRRGRAFCASRKRGDLYLEVVVDTPRDLNVDETPCCANSPRCEVKKFRRPVQES